MFDKKKFMSFYSGTPSEESSSRCYDSIQAQLMNLGIFSELVMAGAMATIRTEVGRIFKPIEELGNGTQYDGRKDLGNDVQGDGPRFKGKGYVQLTGRSNYELYTHKLGVDLVRYPELALDSLVSAKIFANYFKDQGCHTACEARNWLLLRKKINGGTNGLDTFLSIINQYLN